MLRKLGVDPPIEEEMVAMFVEVDYTSNRCIQLEEIMMVGLPSCPPSC